MNIQLALDRMTIDDAINMAKRVKDHVDWIEVGTSLIKEFGMESVKRMKEAFPDKTIVADIKTNDNAKYEFELCFKNGADVATVMGTAPKATIQACISVARQYQKNVMIDLLNVSQENLEMLSQFDQAILCAHVSKDEQELSGKSQCLIQLPSSIIKNNRIAAAGGITIDSMKRLASDSPEVVIIGSAITKAEKPEKVAKEFKDFIRQLI
ncbi:3-hexulose-6-phosphate synthase [Scopulibacillus cellulosilyticus]|uniref:3-hexulose-6-phosphate synthase n=1 Tax=Scopulibacillus cellulosilyticus TaxID=2665665 RepID=A0ABW2PYX3_9BACL